MLRVLALSWRLLLALTLVFNPAVGAMAAALPMEGGAAAGSAPIESAAMPPCHGVGQEVPAQEPAGDTASHGCDCGDPACQLGACCLLAALFVPPQLAMARHGRNPSDASDLRSGALPPPPSRQIRPPIA